MNQPRSLFEHLLTERSGVPSLDMRGSDGEVERGNVLAYAFGGSKVEERSKLLKWRTGPEGASQRDHTVT